MTAPCRLHATSSSEDASSFSLETIQLTQVPLIVKSEARTVKFNVGPLAILRLYRTVAQLLPPSDGITGGDITHQAAAPGFRVSGHATGPHDGVPTTTRDGSRFTVGRSGSTRLEPVMHFW